MRRQNGSITLDTDNYMHILKFLGIENCGAASIYETAMPRLLDILDKYNVKATFFVIGEDILKANNKQMIKKLSINGHEIANHSFTHNRNFSALDYKEKFREIYQSTDILTQTIGRPVVGFRAPAYKIDKETLTILEQLGYKYDSSIFPSWLLILMKLDALLVGRGRERLTSSGHLKFIFAPARPYFPSLNSMIKEGKSGILEIPISVDPLLRMPFYSLFNLLVGMRVFRLLLRLNRASNNPLVYIIHVTELADFSRDDLDARLLRYPGMKKEFNTRYSFFEKAISMLSEDYNLMPLDKLAQLLSAKMSLRAQ